MGGRGLLWREEPLLLGLLLCKWAVSEFFVSEFFVVDSSLCAQVRL
jgi:hypothetical protein